MIMRFIYIGNGIILPGVKMECKKLNEKDLIYFTDLRQRYINDGYEIIKTNF